ncbi:D-alanyl-D-alanine carboxypeptidase [Candidatus Poriferisocius sp.]|uniref:D-alanyl-D-alanine carboxypeptidase n=1 Tax=Candidatus Poriferisocius sp. TaxID=3101276 RepID=UPI003B028F70
MRRIPMPLLLLAVALGALIGSNTLSNRLHQDLGEVATDSSALPGVGTPLISTLRLRDILTPSLTEPDFSTTLDDLMATAPAAACLTVTGDNRVTPIYESGTNIQVAPSEALILTTLATAHKVLGPDHTFTTSVKSTVPMERGVVNGDIYLVGGGDPLLLTEAFRATLTEEQNPLHTPIENLAQLLVDNGLTLVTGAVVGDTSRYDDLRYVPTWPQPLIESKKIGTLLALQFSDGWLQEQVTEGVYLAAEDPPFYAAALFDDMLEDRQVVIRVSPRSEAIPEDGESYELASIKSEPLSDLYQQILTNRDIETIELLLKEIGLAVSETGSTSAGLQAVMDTLDNAGVDADRSQLVQFDGSGIDPANMATCPAFASLLQNQEFSPLFHELLPTGADDGPLRERLAGTREPGRITALAGGTSGTAVIMGYIDIGLDQEVTFVFMANQPGTDDNRAVRDLGDRIVRHLSTLEAVQSLDDIDLEPIRRG